MAFCSSCGGHLEGNERFCAKCGADQTAQTAGAPAVPAAAPPAPAPPAAFPLPPAQPFAGVPPQYPQQPRPVQPISGMPPQFPPPPGQPFSGMPPQFPSPIIMGAPPGAQPASKNPLTWLVVAGVIFGLWYIGTHDKNNQNPGTTPTPQTQPGGGGGGGGGNQNQAIIAAQKFTEGGYNAVNGQIQVTQGQWINGSNVALAAAQLGCEQLDANGQNIAQNPPVTLTGPAPAGGTVTLPTFSIGAVAQGAAKVNCKITAVETEN
jgi:hypothetical protein